MVIIRELIKTHPYVAMDTEFQGVVARPLSEIYSPSFHYKSLKCNVDLLKPPASTTSTSRLKCNVYLLKIT